MEHRQFLQFAVYLTGWTHVAHMGGAHMSRIGRILLCDIKERARATAPLEPAGPRLCILPAPVRPACHMLTREGLPTVSQMDKRVLMPSAFTVAGQCPAYRWAGRPMVRRRAHIHQAG